MWLCDCINTHTQISASVVVLKYDDDDDGDGDDGDDDNVDVDGDGNGDGNDDDVLSLLRKSAEHMSRPLRKTPFLEMKRRRWWSAETRSWLNWKLWCVRPDRWWEP